MMKKLMRIISVALVLTLTLLAFTACGTKPEDEAKKSVETFFKALKSGDAKELDKVTIKEKKTDFLKDISFQGNNEAAQEVAKDLLGKTSYKINSVKADGDNKVIVTAEITSLDFQAIFKTFMKAVFAKAMSQPNLSEKEIENFYLKEFQKAIKANESKTKTIKDVKITVEKVDGKWKVDLDSNLEKGILGNFDPTSLLK